MAQTPQPSALIRLNAFLSALPTVRFGVFGREAPAFRSCGITGFYVAVLATLAAALLGGRSVLSVAALTALCAHSFFAYALLRKRITGREELVLLEHVWFALACSSVAAAYLGESPSVLDPLAVGLAFFLAFGRLGCALAGCCHGRPASVGLVYGAEHAADGFPEHLVHVRLFPVQLLESAALLLMGIAGLAAMPSCAPGSVLAWFLLTYASLRFGLEALRGDRRAHFLGLSQARWMAIVEVAGVLLWRETPERVWSDPHAMIAAVGLVATLALGLAVRKAHDPSRRLLALAHRVELRAMLSELAGQASYAPRCLTSRLGVKLALSLAEDEYVHVSLSLPGTRDLSLACALAAAVVPTIELDSAQFGSNALHVQAPRVALTTPPNAELADALYGTVVRRAQWSASPVLEAPASAGPPDSSALRTLHAACLEPRFSRSDSR